MVTGSVLVLHLRLGWQALLGRTLSSVQLCAEHTRMARITCAEINASFLSAANKTCIQVPPRPRTLVLTKDGASRCWEWDTPFSSQLQGLVLEFPCFQDK